MARDTIFWARHPWQSYERTQYYERTRVIQRYGVIGRGAAAEGIKTNPTIDAYGECFRERILKLAGNVTDQQKIDINSAPFKSLCLDESTNLTKSARLSVFARYCVGNVIKEELIAITSLLTTTKGTDICTAVKNSLAEKEIDLKKLFQ
ncbi:hypothetical protein AVEN_87365-1 [Araneus ventricosus]|uniref:DUF4371 domain-containing protein n=1 Tax=Araneus ventricosus TaxID=182803 RepID=A0A4Y2W3Z1_ARAVE|nr:hypothetical protein AVEN_87365-1 [Araneus ventricosus]